MSRKDMYGNIQHTFAYTSGIDKIFPPYNIRIIINKRQGKLDFINPFPFADKTPKLSIDFDDLCAAGLIDQQSSLKVVQEAGTIQKEKSVIGRAVVGELLLGPVGAIVGGMSGIGTKTVNVKKKTKLIPAKTFFVINYADEHGEIQVVTFELAGEGRSLITSYNEFFDEFETIIPLEYRYNTSE